MFRFNHLLLAAVLSLWPLIAPAAGQWQINTAGFDPSRPPLLAAPAGGKPFAAYYDGAGNIVTRSPHGEPVTLNNGTGKPSGLAFAAFGQRLYAVWRERRDRGGFTLVLRASVDGGASWLDEVAIDSSSQPLTRIELAGDGKGELYVAWLGQRPDEDTPDERRYHLYARRSPDDGRSWGEVQRLTEGYRFSIWPALALRGETAYSFSWSRRGGQKYIVYSRTAADGAWSKPAVIKKGVGDVLLLEPHVFGEHLLLLWFAKNNAGFMLEGAVSDDGEHWRTFAFDDSAGLDIGSIDIASHGDTVYVAFSARRAKPSDPWKHTVYFSRSTDAGATWQPLQRLRHYPFEHTEAYNPRLAVAGPDTVAVVWNDYRNIRGDLYFNVSRDGGQQWLDEDQPLGGRGKTADFLFPFGQTLQAAGDVFHLLAGRYRGDSLGGVADLFLHAFTLEPPALAANPVDDQDSPEKRRQLEQRANAFWQALIDADYKTAYTLFDPFFRAQLREIDYLAASGLVTYHGFELKDVQIQGNIARVVVEYDYEIPQIRLKQSTVSRPRSKVTAAETWLFVEDRWYKEYRSDAAEFTYSRY